MAKDHSEVLDTAITDLITSADDSIKSLENSVADVITAGGGRQEIIREYERYAQNITSNTEPLNSIAANTVASQTDAGIGSGYDLYDASVESTLTEDATGSLRENIMNHAETVTGIVVAGALTGLATDAVIQQARGSVSGLMMSTTDPITTRLQARLARMAADPNRDRQVFNDLRKQIADRLPGITTAGSLSDTLRGVAESVVMRFDGAFTANRAQRYEIERFTYAGGTIENTRPWCADLDGQTMDRDTIVDLWSSNWAGKSGSNPFVDRGGYNCRHYWIPVQED